MQQLPLDLVTPDRFSRDRLITNAALGAVVDDVLTPGAWPSPYILIHGPAGSGKTHVGHIFAETHSARMLTASQTRDYEIGDRRSHVVDDADLASQETLFHLFNAAQASGGYLVLLTRLHPLQWPVEVLDWQSRLRAMRLVTLPQPDEDLLAAILSNLFAQRAISPSPDAIAYIASRADRSVAALQKFVTELEHYANGRAFTRALARNFFEQSETLPFGDAE